MAIGIEVVGRFMTLADAANGFATLAADRNTEIQVRDTAGDLHAAINWTGEYPDRPVGFVCAVPRRSPGKAGWNVDGNPPVFATREAAIERVTAHLRTAGVEV